MGGFVNVWAALNGIRMFHGCVQFGDARSKYDRRSYIKVGNNFDNPMEISLPTCQRIFGFTPSKGSAWECFNGRKPKRIDQDMDFSS